MESNKQQHIDHRNTEMHLAELDHLYGAQV
jgi:hypothetical protein